MNIITEYWQTIVGAITGATGLIYGYQKNKTDNIKAIQDIYQKMIDDVKERMVEMQKKIDQMEKDMETLHLENAELKRTNARLLTEIKKIKK